MYVHITAVFHTQHAVTICPLLPTHADLASAGSSIADVMSSTIVFFSDHIHMAIFNPL